MFERGIFFEMILKVYFPMQPIAALAEQTQKSQGNDAGAAEKKFFESEAEREEAGTTARIPLHGNEILFSSYNVEDAGEKGFPKTDFLLHPFFMIRSGENFLFSIGPSPIPYFTTPGNNHRRGPL